VTHYNNKPSPIGICLTSEDPQTLDPDGFTDNQAFRSYKESAEQGEIFAQYNLAEMYYEGKGVARDYATALFWYRKVAEQGSEKAQLKVGHMYETGRGIPQHNTYAYVWFNLAASHGNETAEDKRERVARQMTAKQMEEAQALSTTYYQRYVLPFR
jgi:TPR repeat protein